MVSDHHGGCLWLDRRPISPVIAAALALPVAAGAQALAPVRDRRRRHSGIADGSCRATPRAAARWCSIAPRPASSAIPGRFRKPVPGRSRARPRRRRQPLDGKPVAASAGRCLAFQSGRPSCRPIIASTGLDRVGRNWNGKPILIGGTDRGYRGLSCNASGLGPISHEATHHTTRRSFLGLAGGAAVAARSRS